jgi:pimeloyl-ACP methyl ester carboxylesterase
MKRLALQCQQNLGAIALTSIVGLLSMMELARSTVHAQDGSGSIEPLVASVIDAVRGTVVSAKQGLVFNQPASGGGRSKPSVVLIPGLLASPGSMDAVVSEIEKHAFSTAVFHYSSHQGIKSAAIQLATELRNLRVTQPDRPVVLLTHSMGGLVARCCVEDAALNPGNVKQLILIAPPNHGSAVARLSATEVSKRLGWRKRIGQSSLKSIDDVAGSLFGVAKDDLLPGSTTLLELNARLRAEGVRYSVIAGSGGPVPGELLQLSLLFGNLLLPEDPETQAALQSASDLACLDEWTVGRGDGVVSVSSAKLSGVQDFVTLPFLHNEFGDKTSKASNQVIAEVMKRLETH